MGYDQCLLREGEENEGNRLSEDGHLQERAPCHQGHVRFVRDYPVQNNREVDKLLLGRVWDDMPRGNAGEYFSSPMSLEIR